MLEMSCNPPLTNYHNNGFDGNEKWKAILDSVYEFITASKTMLHVLNEKAKSEEKISEEQLRRLVDEEVKLASYRASFDLDQPNNNNTNQKPESNEEDSLSVDIYSQEFELAKEDLNSSQTAYEICPSGHLISTICISEVHASSIIKLNDEEAASNSFQSTNKPKLLKSSVEIQSDFSDQMVSIESPSLDDEEKLRVLQCKEKSTSSLAESGNNPMCCRHGKLISQKCHLSNVSCQGAIKKEVEEKPIRHRISRIPRCKHLEQKTSKVTRIEKQPNEGPNIGVKPLCKNCHKNTYSGLRLKAGAPKGDNN